MLSQRGVSHWPDVVIFLSALILSNDLQLVSSVDLTYSSHEVFGRMPASIDLTLTTTTKVKLTFKLIHIDDFNLDTKLFTMTTNPDGSLQYKKEAPADDQNTGFYEDVASAAIFQVDRKNDITINRGTHLQFRGHFFMGNFTYTLETKRRTRRDLNTAGISREVEYVLREQVRRQLQFHDDAVKYKVVEDVKTSAEIQTPIRHKRQAPDIYYIDIAAVVDYKSYSIFLDRHSIRTTALQKVLEYYSYVIAGVDLLYQGITSSNFRIRVRLIKVIVAEVASASNFTEAFAKPTDSLDGDTALSAFRTFLATDDSDVIKTYDHAMLFTGYNLTSHNDSNPEETDIIGMAFMGTMCDTNGSSSSVVEDVGEFQSIEVAAHELGHSLSADHDGSNNTCRFDDDFIMAPVLASVYNRRKLNPWRFSKCTIESFDNFLKQLLQTSVGASCLTGKIPKSSNNPDAEDGLPGLKYPAQEQCKMWYGNDSSVCLGDEDYLQLFNPSSQCKTIRCTSPSNSNYCFSKIPLPGTPCSDGKLCLYGDCIQHPLAPKNGFCMFYDVPMLNCSQEIRTNPSLCSSQLYKRFCCVSCMLHSENPPSLTTSVPTTIQGEDLLFSTTTLKTTKETEKIQKINTSAPTTIQGGNLPYSHSPITKVTDGTRFPYLATTAAVAGPESTGHQNAASEMVPTKSDVGLIVFASVEGACIIILLLSQIIWCLKFKAMKRKEMSEPLLEQCDSTLI